MKRPFVWFTFGVVAPGLILAALGMLAIRRDWRALDEEIAARTTQAAAEAARRVDEEVNRWREAVRAASAVASSPQAIALLPGALADAFRDPGAAVFVSATSSGWAAAPEGALLYRPDIAGPDAVPRDLVERYSHCVRLEKGEGDALRACGGRLYDDLVAGRWLFVKPLFVFYVERARAWADRTDVRGTSINPAAAALERRQALAAAVEGAFERAARRGGDGQSLFVLGNQPRFLAIMQPLPRSEGWAALVVSEGTLSQSLFTTALGRMASAGYALAVEAEGGERLFSSPASARTPPEALPFVRAASLASTGLAARVRVWPLDVPALHGRLALRRRIYVALLAVVVAAIAFGSSFTARAIRRELRAARMQSEFVSTVTHEFRTPLTGIRQLTEMLVDGRVPSHERRQEYYRVIMRESNRLERLVENVLGMSRLAPGNRLFSFEPLDTSRWLKWLATECEQEQAARSRHVVADIPEGLPAVAGDRDALTNAVRNLVDNASKYSRDCDTVWLSAAAEGNGREVVIRVRDRGIGIPAPEHERIFERFYRCPGASRSVPGSGLGLALVRQVMTAHGGRVSVQSAAGEGSTFSLTLPVTSASGEE